MGPVRRARSPRPWRPSGPIWCWSRARRSSTRSSRWSADPEMVPPVAALIYAADQPRLASFYPLADFSPEWVAIRWAASTGTPVRTIDLPAATQLRAARSRGSGRGACRRHTEAQDGAGDEHRGGRRRTGSPPPQQPYRPDAIAMLAQAAGYSDAERWWEDAVEHRIPIPSTGSRPLPTPSRRSAPWTTGPPATPTSSRTTAAKPRCGGCCVPPCARGTHGSPWCAAPITPPRWCRRTFLRRRRTTRFWPVCPRPRSPSRGCRGRRTGSACKPDTGPASRRPAGTSICSPTGLPRDRHG